MNMKSILFAATAALAVSLQAAVEANNTLCRIQVDSSAKSVIVAVPLVAVGSGDIKVTDYIMTTNLKEGDSILQWNSTTSAWEGWVINASGAWEAATSVSVNGVSTTEPADDSALARGAAVWLNRSEATITENSSFYLYGQVASDAVTLTAEAGKYTLLGNPTTSTLDLSTLSWSNSTVGDTIYLSSETTGVIKHYEYRVPTDGNTAAWCSKTVTKNEKGFSKTTYTAISSGAVTLAPGEGFWYNSKGTATPTVTIE